MAEIGNRLPRLVVTYHESVVSEVQLPDQELTIGRKSNNRVVLEDGAVSSHHARVVKIQSVFFLEDLGSTNGTFVNGKRIDRQQLRDGDVVTIGTHRLTFREEVGERLIQRQCEAADPDGTMILKPRTASAVGHGQARIGILQVVSGRTSHQQYALHNKLTIVGGRRDAQVRLRGWFAPRVAAMIGQRGPGYYLSPSTRGNNVRVNQAAVTGLSI